MYTYEIKNNMKTYTTNSQYQTKALAKNFAKTINQKVIALSGDLGAGKTTFVQGFARGLGIKEKIISPTFILIRQHTIPQKKNTLFHIDLYRLADNPKIKDLGIEEIWSNPNNIVLIEWAEKINKFLPKNILKVSIEKQAENIRKITIF